MKVQSEQSVQERSGSVGVHDWCLGKECGDGVLVFVDDRPVCYKPNDELAREHALQVIQRCDADGGYRLSDQPQGFYPPPIADQTIVPDLKQLVTTQEENALSVSIIAAKLGSALTENLNDGFCNHESHIDIYTDIAQLALFAESLSANAGFEKGDDIDAFANKLRSLITEESYTLSEAKKQLAVQLGREEDCFTVLQETKFEFIFEAESAVAMSCQFWDVVLQNKDQAILAVAQFALLSARIYRHECMQGSGVWLYDVDSPFGMYLVQKHIDETFNQLEAIRYFEEILRKYYLAEPQQNEEIESLLNIYFPKVETK